MTGSHLTYVAAAYILALGVPLVLSVGALLRVKTAQRKLAAIDPRGERAGP